MPLLEWGYLVLVATLGQAVVANAALTMLPRAWGISGCASVVSAVLAPLLAIHFG